MDLSSQKDVCQGNIVSGKEFTADILFEELSERSCRSTRDLWICRLPCVSRRASVQFAIGERALNHPPYHFCALVDIILSKVSPLINQNGIFDVVAKLRLRASEATIIKWCMVIPSVTPASDYLLYVLFLIIGLSIRLILLKS
jgi:hypothetical protein